MDKSIIMKDKEIGKLSSAISQFKKNKRGDIMALRAALLATMLAMAPVAAFADLARPGTPGVRAAHGLLASAAAGEHRQHRTVPATAPGAGDKRGRST